MNVNLPQVIQELPGVQSAGGTAAAQSTKEAASPAPQAVVYEGSGPSTQSNARMDVRQQQFAADMKNNSELTAQLRKIGQPADARGLAMVAGKAMRHGAAFSKTVDNARAVSLSMGKNPTAIKSYQSSAMAFTSKAKIARNNYGDLHYLITRISGRQAEKSQQGVKQAIQEQVQNNLKLMDALQQYETGLQQKIAQVGTSSKLTDVAESDFRVGADNQIERVEDTAPDSSVGSKKSAAEAGPKIDGVTNSGTNPPRVVRMDRAQLETELKETQVQLRALATANAQLQKIANRTAQGAVNPAWFTIAPATKNPV